MVIPSLILDLLDIKVKVDRKIIITKSRYIDEWYNNIHIAIWKDEKNINISIDPGFSELSSSDKDKIQKNKKLIEDNKELFKKAGFEFSPVRDGFKLYAIQQQKIETFIEMIIKILTAVYLLIKICKEIDH